MRKNVVLQKFETIYGKFMQTFALVQIQYAQNIMQKFFLKFCIIIYEFHFSAQTSLLDLPSVNQLWYVVSFYL